MGVVLVAIVALACVALALAGLIAALRGRLKRRSFFGSAWDEDGPPWEESLVPVGPPKQPQPSSALALPLPDPEPGIVEAYGGELPEGGEGTDALAS